MITKHEGRGSSLISAPAKRLAGDVSVPGDKSISHRALLLGAAAVGETRIRGLLDSEDVRSSADALAALGAGIARDPDGAWRVRGCGVGGFREPDRILDMGNSGTSARLLMGFLATHSFTSFLCGDASLSNRPMERVITPLTRMGGRFVGRSGGRLPLAVIGTADPLPLVYELPVASAQVKSAILLAGLNTAGETTVVEPRPTRDHTELMLTQFGADIAIERLETGGRAITVTGQPEIAGIEIAVPGDFSSAAFPLVAALVVPGSAVKLRGVGLNPLRSGLLETLVEMGARVSPSEHRAEAGEPVSDLTVEAASLRGVDVPPARAPAMIDEYPILAVAAACASGVTRFEGVGELRVKESDRLSAMARGLGACGVKVEETADSLVIHGNGAPPRGGGDVTVNRDHRIAMAFLVLGMAARQPVRIDDGHPIQTSFPGFVGLMNGLGARISEDGSDA